MFQGRARAGTVHLRYVATQDDGRALAKKVNTAALDRIAFFRSLWVENALIIGEQFSSVNPPSGVFAVSAGSYLLLGGSATCFLGISSPHLRIQLEQLVPRGERNFGLLQSARQSESPVDNVLLMFFSDRQVDVDSFILKEDSAVPQTQHTRKAGTMETVYTRLRNELQ